MKSKKLKAYLILLGYLFIVVLGLVICFVIDHIYGADLVGYSGIYILIVFPLAAAVYGIISYSLMKRIILPNLLLLLFVSAFMFLLLLLGLVSNEGVLFSYSHLLEEMLEASPFIGIVTAISVFFSLVTKFISKISDDKEKKETSPDE